LAGPARRAKTPVVQKAPPDPQETLPSLTRAAVAEVRLANAIGLGWIRVGLRSATLVLQLWLLLAAGKPMFLVPSATNLCHLLAGCAVLWLLRARWHVSLVILLGAASDFAVVALGAARAALIQSGNTDAALYFMAVFELVLLFAALTLPTRQVAALGVGSWAMTAWLCAQVGLPAADTAFVLVTLAAFAFVAAWAGTRLFSLAVATAVERYTAARERAHNEQLERARVELLAAQAQAEGLAQLIVHDLRNPLGAISLNLDEAQLLFGQTPGDEGGLAALDQARVSLRRLNSMIGQLLVISRLEGGAGTAPAPTPLRALLESVSGALAPGLARAGVQLAVAAAQDLVFPLDADLARRMVENLLMNAARHAGSGDRIELRAERRETGLFLAVRNTGPAVPEAVKAHLFEKFSTPGGERRGAGLGLYLCRLVAEAHGGTLRLCEREGWSVSFEAELPG
jgi:signal transduction histidine kinase